MKQKISEVTRRYATTLQKYLQSGVAGGVKTALRLGQFAAAGGLETLDLARIHEVALVELGIRDTSAPEAKRAEAFFAEAITPIMESHRSSKENRRQLKLQGDALTQRTRELAATNLQLQHGIVRRKKVEAALKQSGIHYAKLLKDSLQLQAGLRRLTRQVLSAQEDERTHISASLQHEIAQTLLGINVRLLTLKQEATVNTKGLKDEIASTQKLVAKSARSIRRVARQFNS
jgi:signal transduction histidine kinase